MIYLSEANKKLTEANGVYSCNDTERFVDILKAEYDGFFSIEDKGKGELVFTSTQSHGFTTEITVDTWGEYVSLAVYRDRNFIYSFVSIDITLVKKIRCARRALYIDMNPGSRVNGNQIIVAVY